MRTEQSRSDRATAMARSELARRALRSKFFGPKLIDDAAWNMMLFMFVEQRVDLPISRVCAAALAPRTTALRQLSVLESRGLVEFHENPEDRRGRFVKLQTDGLATLGSYLAAIAEIAVEPLP